MNFPQRFTPELDDGKVWSIDSRNYIFCENNFWNQEIMVMVACCTCGAGNIWL